MTTAAAGNKLWADGPFKLISHSALKLKEGEKPQGAKTAAFEMTIVHNLLLRALNSIYLQCVNVGKSGTPQEVNDFVNYASCWYTTLSHHHHIEESMIFPEIERLAGVPGLMAQNVAQHEAFHDGLEAYKKYLDAVQAGDDKYDGDKLKGIIDSFAGVLHQHLTEEIDTLVKLEEEHGDKTDWATWFKKTMDKILKQSQDPKNTTTVVPLTFTNHDKSFEGGVHASWPPLPWFVMLLLRWWYVPKNKGWWRFSSCDDQMRPKELPFA
ncbi:hemerythrin HHE cation binding domain-containing protein [Dactylonectria macrodidyma]|uniref:Hemerythrin HHE cation binding domain-containing protein n=1 Tax=Dactylonectria macrodidyma TaxID=307937 RepID=A0A9P9F913_9HYPO|nr:hemerythrin HHE cation binding domain-containing protein [Dactylonectria macrodidyma]